jgi:hypothetical protein
VMSIDRDRTRTLLIAAGLAAVIEATLLVLFLPFGHVGGDRAIIFVLHLPGAFIAEKLHLAATAATGLIVFTGFLQWSLASWLAISVWNGGKAEVATIGNAFVRDVADARKLSAYRAARFSCYSSLAVWLLLFCWYSLGGFGGGPHGHEHSDIGGTLLLFCFLMLPIAFARGITGLTGGPHRGRLRTVLFVAVGLVLSGFPLGFVVYGCLASR